MSTPITTLKFFISEDEQSFPVSSMTEPETAAIEECVTGLIPRKFQFTGKFWFEADTCLYTGFGEEEDEDENGQREYGILKCVTHDPTTTAYKTIPYPFPQEVLDEFLADGKDFRIRPKQYGLNPWGKNVRVTFETPFEDIPDDSVIEITDVGRAYLAELNAAVLALAAKQAPKQVAVQKEETIPDDAVITLTEKGKEFVAAMNAAMEKIATEEAATKTPFSSSIFASQVV